MNTEVLGFEVDFHWPDRRLAAEVDGPGHGRPPSARDDARRDATLAARGYTLLRFTAEDVFRRPDVVTGRLREQGLRCYRGQR